MPDTNVPDPCTSFATIFECLLKEIGNGHRVRPPIKVSSKIEEQVELALQQSSDTTLAGRAVVAARVLEQAGLHGEALIFSRAVPRLLAVSDTTQAATLIQGMNIQEQALRGMNHVEQAEDIAALRAHVSRLATEASH